MHECFWRLSSPEGREGLSVWETGNWGGIEFALSDEGLISRKGRGVGAETSWQRKQRGKECGEGRTVGCFVKVKNLVQMKHSGCISHPDVLAPRALGCP